HAGVAARLHRPGAVFLLRRDEEGHAALDLGLVLGDARKAQEIQSLAGGVSIAGQILELTPTSVLVLPRQELADSFLQLLRRLAVLYVAEHAQRYRLRTLTRLGLFQPSDSLLPAVASVGFLFGIGG